MQQQDQHMQSLDKQRSLYLGLPRVCVNFDTNVSTDMKTGAVNAAAGSAYAEFGQTKVIVSV